LYVVAFTKILVRGQSRAEGAVMVMMVLVALCMFVGKCSSGLRLADDEWRDDHVCRGMAGHGRMAPCCFRWHCEGPLWGSRFGGCRPAVLQVWLRVGPEFVGDDGDFGLVGSAHSRQW